MLTITLLGTAATMPLPERALTAAVAECGGHSLLLDCGEGTQTAARRAGVNLMRADAICLTHYHGDHIFGLPGLLQTLGAQGRTRSLVLLGPEGLLEVWRAVYALTGPLPYAVKPLVCRAGQPVALDALSDGWPAGATLLPVATKHRVRSLGYRLDLPRAGRFDPEKARALGVPVTQWRLLQRGCGSSFPATVRPARRWNRRRRGQTCCSAMPPMPCRSSRSRPRSGGTAPLAKAQRWRQKPGQSGCGWCTIPPWSPTRRSILHRRKASSRRQNAALTANASPCITRRTRNEADT